MGPQHHSPWNMRVHIMN